MEIPSYKTKDKCGYISTKNCLEDFTPDKKYEWLYVKQDDLGQKIYNIDKKKQILTFPLERQSYIPALVYKCLVKFALSLLPSRYLVHFKDSLEWLISNDLKPLNPMLMFMLEVREYNPFFKTLQLQGFINTTLQTDYVYYWMIIRYGYLSLHFPVLSCFEIRKGCPSNIQLPCILYDYERAKVVQKDLSSTEKVCNDVFEYKLPYGREEEVLD